MSVFLPFFRSHTHLHHADQEPWSWGEPHLSINRSWIRHRYRLLPYLYTAFWQCARTGLPIARPLVLAFQDDPATPALDDQFLCGDHLLVAPVLNEGATQRSVYIPAGTWYDVWTDQPMTGPARVKVQAPLGRIPVFVQAGAVVPTAPPLHYVSEQPFDHLTLHVYPPAHTRPGRQTRSEGRCSSSVLYEDDGETYAYHDGDFLVSRFRLSAQGNPLSHLHLRRETEGQHRPTHDHFEIMIHGVERLPSAAAWDGTPVESDQIDGHPRTLRLRAGLFEHLVLEWE